MATSLRLPDSLQAAARAKAEYLGISLNALVCVALDAYLSHPADPAAPAKAPAPADVGAPIEAPRPGKPSKAERRELTRLQRLARKS